VAAPPDAGVLVAKPAFEIEGEESEEGGGEASGGSEKWLAIAASVVALLSAVTSFMAYSSLK
jgi:hypothetical protein